MFAVGVDIPRPAGNDLARAAGVVKVKKVKNFARILYLDLAQTDPFCQSPMVAYGYRIEREKEDHEPAEDRQPAHRSGGAGAEGREARVGGQGNERHGP